MENLRKAKSMKISQKYGQIKERKINENLSKIWKINRIRIRRENKTRKNIPFYLHLAIFKSND